MSNISLTIIIMFFYIFNYKIFYLIILQEIEQLLKQKTKGANRF